MHEIAEVRSEYSAGIHSPYRPAANPKRPTSIHELFNEQREEAGLGWGLFSPQGISKFGERSQPRLTSDLDNINLAWPFAKPKTLETQGEPFKRARQLEQNWDRKLLWEGR